MPVTARDICQDALYEIRALAPDTDTIEERLGAFVLSRLNQLVDQWNATRELVFCQLFESFLFIGGQQDYTIGPTDTIPPDFVVTGNRPVVIDGANILLNNVDPVVSNGINLRDYQWWLGLPVRGISTSFPTDLYYEPNWPNGILHFWPVPDTAYGLELTYRTVLSQFEMNTAFSMPPGYQKALTLTLAENIAPALGATALSSFGQTKQAASLARVQIGINNDFVPTIATQDSGMPGNYGYRTSFNYLTGMNRPPSRG